ncbi:hypothetical protein GIB67_008110 [Kingdonia uniflora]|uniref:Nucleolar complex protein 3 homolog n=1 Tax=Kingdonia uniflora TaxID=39325 RepID=A0A7J7MH31_9MAGN|nr:hypothetical protein GIB67_008110 [Kingdonia uniflora]
MGKKNKIILPPQLPPDIADDDIEVSDEDLSFVKESKLYARFLKNLDTKSINNHVSRVADAKDGTLEASYENRKRNKFSDGEPKENGIEVDRVDVLLVKTLDGNLIFKIRKPKVNEKEDEGAADNDGIRDSLVKLTKPERREKLKKSKKEAKQQAEIKEDLSAEKLFEVKKNKLTELGMSLLADPEANIKSLKEIVEISKDEDRDIVKLRLLSLLAVFKDIIPSYRIRLPTEKELQMNVSKAVKKTQFYESTLLTTYKVYLQRLIAFEKKSSFQHVYVRCICTLLEAVPHFNFRGNLLAVVVNNISSTDDVIRKLCCSTLRSLFTNEAKHGGEATLEAVQLIAEHVKVHDCQLHPDSIEVLISSSKLLSIPRSNKQSSPETVFLYLTFAEDLGKSEMPKDEIQYKLIFGRFGAHPLLAPCLNGLGKVSYLLDIDFMGDLMNCLKKLACAGSNSDGSLEGSLTVSERLWCCIVTFRVMRNNLDALNVDLHEFFVQLYTLLLEYRPDRDRGEVLAEALRTMLCEGRQQDMQRAAAFIKRLATFSLSFGSAEAMAALVTLRDLLQKNVKCRNLLENDAGGGTLSGSVAKYQACASDPNQSGALASVLWELSLLCKHYHPVISSAASTISNMNTAQNQVYLATTTPQQAFKDLNIEHEVFDAKGNLGISNKKKKNTTRSSAIGIDDPTNLYRDDEEDLKRRFEEHFTVLRDIGENRRLRRELNRTVSSLRLYEEYKQKKRSKEVPYKDQRWKYNLIV